MPKVSEEIRYIKYELALTSDGWTILMLNQERSKGDTKLDLNHSFLQRFPVHGVVCV